MSELWTILMFMSCTYHIVTGSSQLIATGDNTLRVYADGRQIGYTNNWKNAMRVTIPTNTQVLAMQSTDWGGACGIVAKVNTGEKTDTSWKCSPNNQPGWTTPTFDDSLWSNAINFGPYGQGIWGNQVNPDPYGANWIWAAGGCRHRTVYCRKRLGDRQLIATGDNTVTVHVDGRRVASSSDWTKAVHISIPENSQIIAMQSTDWGVACGIAATISPGEKTDTSWKCSANYQPGWTSPTFDDGQWSNAISFGQYGQGIWGDRVSPKPYGANWIWAAGGCQHRTVYCRKRLGGRQLIATGDNTLTVYVDGRWVSFSSDWTKAVHISIPENAQVLAMQSTDWGVACGIVATVSTGEKTDTSWKCSTNYQRGWTSPTFNDRLWSNAMSFGPYGQGIWGNRVNPDPYGANWIWAVGGCRHRTVYCRKRLR